MKKHLRLLSSLIVPALVLILAACGTTQNGGDTYGTGGTTPAATTGTTPPASGTTGAVIKTGKVTAGGNEVTVLTNKDGWTLYYFTPDTATESKCTGGCATTWPPYLSDGKPTTTATLPGKLDVQKNVHGSQVTYQGHPLYTYVGDTAAGQANGDGSGGKWYVAKLDLQPLGTPPLGS
jgi:predicted lipoprotein with Yx(FWY)xxD motif